MALGDKQSSNDDQHGLPKFVKKPRNERENKNAQGRKNFRLKFGKAQGTDGNGGKR